MSDRPVATTEEAELLEKMLSPEIRLDPYAFVMYAFPWGVPSSPIEQHAKPREWQKREMLKIAAHMRMNVKRMQEGKTPEMYKLAIASGRGVGKSALVAWIVLWAMSTAIGLSICVTANTESQLKNRTWAEIGKWHAMSINSHWFEKYRMSLRAEKWLIKLLEKTASIDSGLYYAVAELWNEDKPDAFAGLHNYRGVMLIMDEASGIPKNIWKVCKGFFTEPVLFRFWIAFSNPRNPDGAFYDCFHADAEYWNTVNIDGRDVEGLDMAIFDEIIKTDGIDSREARVEVMGKFPEFGESQLISLAMVRKSMAADATQQHRGANPLFLGIDIARHGADKSVLVFRQGRAVDMPIDYSIPDYTMLADEIGKWIQERNPAAVFIDAGGGYGVIDILRRKGFNVFPVPFGSKPLNPVFRDKKAEMFDAVKDWLADGGVLPPHKRLETDLTALRYNYNPVNHKKYIQDKDKMESWYPYSTDFADALALTFYQPIGFASRAMNDTGRVSGSGDYDPFSHPGMNAEPVRKENPFHPPTNHKLY